jgi:hypothetical protein
MRILLQKVAKGFGGSLFAFIIFCAIFAPRADAQTQIITATLTVTNIATNGYNLIINGHSRNFTNSVPSANIQILTNLTEAGTATNLFNAFISYPETSPYLNVQMTASNVIQFQTLAGSPPALTVATNWGGPGTASIASFWLTWTLSTQTLSSAQVVRLPTNGIGLIEKTNDQNWFVGLFNDPGVTNAFFYGAPLFREFLGTNFGTALGTALSNYVFATSNSLITITSNTSVGVSNAVIFWSSNYTDLEVNLGSNYTHAASNSLWTLFDPLLGAIAPWIDSAGSSGYGTGSIVLTNSSGYGPGSAQAKRMTAQYQGEFSLYANTTAPGTPVFLDEVDDGTGFDLYLKDSTSKARFGMVDPGGSGATFLQGASGTSPGNPLQSDFAISPVSQVVYTAFPVAFGSQLLPAATVGTLTNFFNITTSGSGEQPYDQYTIPANVFTNLGDTITRRVGITLSGTGTWEIKVYAFADTIFDTGSFATTGASTLSITAECTASTLGGSGNLNYNVSVIGANLSTATLVHVGTLGANFTSPGLLKLGITDGSGQSATIYTDNIQYAPSSIWTIQP